MPLHLALFRFASDVSAAERADFDRAARTIAADNPHVLELRAGPALRLQDSPYDYALIVRVPEDGFEAYKASPQHRAFVAEQAHRIAETARIQIRG